jgi:hypothetical protein
MASVGQEKHKTKALKIFGAGHGAQSTGHRAQGKGRGARRSVFSIQYSVIGEKA